MIKSNSKQSTETEDHILDAAKKVFEEKGYSGARMQTIADSAGINKSLLHYYYRSKEKLFSKVFNVAFKQLSSRLHFLGDKNMPLFEKIEKFYSVQMSVLMRNPKLPAFILNELNHNSELLLNNVRQLSLSENIKILIEQIKDEMEKGNLVKIPPEQFIVNLVSLSVFPFAAAGMLSEVLKIEKKNYKLFLKERKQLLSDYVLTILKNDATV